MLANVRSFYAKGDAREAVFAVLSAGAALFIAIFSVVVQLASYYGASIALPYAMAVLAACIFAMALLLRGCSFTVPRTARLGLLVALAVSLLIYPLIA